MKKFKALLCLLVLTLNQNGWARSDKPLTEMNPGEREGEEWVQSEEFLKCVACMAKKGRVRDPGDSKGGELSAWLVKKDDKVECQLWPYRETDLWNPSSKDRNRKSVVGWPPSTVGILHSHPASAKIEPSAQDAEVATKYRMPNFVVSRGGLWSYSSRTARNFQHADYEAIQKVQKNLEKEECKTLLVVPEITTTQASNTNKNNYGPDATQGVGR